MTRRPSAPANLRNGLKWRDGRPRWEPSPASRAHAIPGVALRWPDGRWMDRGDAIAAADLRHEWARCVREALVETAAGDDARRVLRAVLADWTVGDDDSQRARRALSADLVERARAILRGRNDAPARPAAAMPRSGQAMINGYLADVDADRLRPRISRSTRRIYGVWARRIQARFGQDPVTDISRRRVLDWHEAMIDEGLTPGSARAGVATLSAMLTWAGYQDPPWIPHHPLSRLRLPESPGRLVFWTFEEERDFVAWCDVNGFADVGDIVTYGCWTGANQIDLCAATVEALSGPTWRYVRHKTRRHGREALVGVLGPVRARLERRRQEVAGAVVRRAHGIALIGAAAGGIEAQTSAGIGDRFRRARAGAIAAGVLPPDFSKQLRDTRDTCVTRLDAAGVDIKQMWRWTGHSAQDAERILRAHYLYLQDQQSLEMGQKLADHARALGFAV